jgi:hypothetical protein
MNRELGIKNYESGIVNSESRIENHEILQSSLLLKLFPAYRQAGVKN